MADFGKTKVGKKSPVRGSAIEFDSVLKSTLRTGFRGIGVAGTNLTDAVTTIGACNARSHLLLSEGFRMLAGIEALDFVDNDEVMDESDCDMRSAHEILEDQEEEHEAYEELMQLRRHNVFSDEGYPEGTIQVLRTDGVPDEFLNGGCVQQRPKHGVHRRQIRSRRGRDSNVRFCAIPNESRGVKPVTAGDKRAQLKTRLEKAGMSESKATEIAAKAKFETPKVGTLGATVFESITKNGSIAALNVKPEPAPHRVRHIRTGVVARTTSSANA